MVEAISPEGRLDASLIAFAALERYLAACSLTRTIQNVSTTQNRNRSGRWPKGILGNPGGRPQGLARATRELVGEDGIALAQIWWDIARDETRRDSDRLEASKLLADWGWGKAGVFSPQEGDPLDLALAEGRLRSSGRRSCGREWVGQGALMLAGALVKRANAILCPSGDQAGVKVGAQAPGAPADRDAAERMWSPVPSALATWRTA